jgi:hypothetical protein
MISKYPWFLYGTSFIPILKTFECKTVFIGTRVGFRIPCSSFKGIADIECVKNGDGMVKIEFIDRDGG